MSQLWPVLLGALLAITGGYLGARWQGQQQRANLLHEARIDLYAELFTDCRARRIHICDSPYPYPASVSLRAKVDFLASAATKQAWAAMEAAEEEGVMLGVVGSSSEERGWTILVSPSEGRQWRLKLLDRVEDALRADLARGPAKSVWWDRVRPWLGDLRESAIWIMNPSVRRAASRELVDALMVAEHRMRIAKSSKNPPPAGVCATPDCPNPTYTSYCWHCELGER